MPLLHQGNGRGGDGSRDTHDMNLNRRSLADLLGLDASKLPQPVSTPALAQHSNDCDESLWRWNEASSPEAAQTPRSLVPAGCFPPRHTAAYASYSESAQLGAQWPEESNSGQGMTALVASLSTMGLQSQSTRSIYASVPPSVTLSYDQLEKAGKQPWPPEQAGTSVHDDNTTFLTRRASFCGATSAGREWHGRREERDVVWTGTLPPRCADPAGGFSAKVFLGGLPWDISEQALMQTLKTFHPVRVEWPGRESGGGSPRGYAYVTFESERRVRALLAASRCDGRDWYYRITSRKMRNKEVQVIPWAVSDCNWMSGGSARLEPSRTVFVGALHGMISAAGLATIMNELFPGVVYAGIDTDKNKYPIGSGRVTFNNVRSYVRAISAAYIEIRTMKFTKKVQVDPYLEDSMCSVCKLQQGPYFCREPTCFGYFCRSCWTWSHANESHKPLMRSSKSAHFSHQYNGMQPTLPALATVPAVPAFSALPVITAHAHNNERTLFNGSYTKGMSSTTSAISLMSGTREPEPCIGSESVEAAEPAPAEPNWAR